MQAVAANAAAAAAAASGSGSGGRRKKIIRATRDVRSEFAEDLLKSRFRAGNFIQEALVSGEVSKGSF